MSNKLVVVESPTKAKTISRFLGSMAQVMASQGHVRDLPEHALGVEIDNDFKPDYELTPNGKKIVNQLKQAAKGASDIYLATDPDREGEAIAWHLQEVLKPASKAQFHRITFHEITKSAIQKSFAQPGVIDDNMVDAQQARRVLDRIVGYQVSPILWRSIRGATSAGRVQTVALRLVVEREREIMAFVPVESWNLDAKFDTLNPQSSFRARLAKVNGNNIKISNGELAGIIADALQSQGVTHTVSKITSTPRTKNPPPPFITSTLQQAAGSNLGLGASQTMRIAQELYEGIDLGSGQVGLITYMRTDSFNIAKEAQDQALQLIAQKFGPAYVPAKPNHYRAGKNAQEAHEAIRPTDMQYSPEAIARYLTPQQLKIYTLIWNRFLASQMAPARQMDHLIEVESQGGTLAALNQEKFIANPEKQAPAADGVVCQFRATSRETIFPGFLMAYKYREVGEEEEEGLSSNLPNVPVGTDCQMSDLKREQCFSQPPPRYSEASLVKALEQNGVGRPSTYASTVNTIQERSYVSKSGGSLKPTELGFKVCDFLLGRIETLFEVKFTADMEDKLDNIEEGTENWIDMLRDFYVKFQGWLGMKALDATSDETAVIGELLQCFPNGFKYAEPVSVGRKKYDDSKFIASIRQRFDKHSPITDRQWNALLMTAVKYSPEHPEIQTVLNKHNLGEKAEEMKSAIDKHDSAPKEPVSLEALALIKAMDNVSFEAPVKRTGRSKVFDDAKFVKSLREQAEAGKALSEAQSKALLKLSSKYAESIDNYAALTGALAAAVGAEVPVAASTPVKAEEPAQPAKETEKDLAEMKALIQMSSEIGEWKSGHGKFDDKSFVASLCKQFEQKNTLSAKQVSALYKVVSKYADQIHDFEARCKDFTCVPKKKNDEDLGTCPLCGSKLVTRYYRGRSFIGCSGYPNCKYIQNNKG